MVKLKNILKSKVATVAASVASTILIMSAFGKNSNTASNSSPDKGDSVSYEQLEDASDNKYGSLAEDLEASFGSIQSIEIRGAEGFIKGKFLENGDFSVELKDKFGQTGRAKRTGDEIDFSYKDLNGREVSGHLKDSVPTDSPTGNSPLKGLDQMKENIGFQNGPGISSSQAAQDLAPEEDSMTQSQGQTGARKTKNTSLSRLASRRGSRTH